MTLAYKPISHFDNKNDKNNRIEQKYDNIFLITTKNGINIKGFIIFINSKISLLIINILNFQN